MEVSQEARPTDQLKKAISSAKASIERLVSHVKLTDSRYPYFPLTFSLWRCDRYQEIIDATHCQLHSQAALQFHMAVDNSLLNEFCSKVEESILACFNELKTPQSLKLKQLIGQNDTLVEDYSRAAARQLTMLQLWVDLVSMPYAIPVKETLRVQRKYSLDTDASGSSLTDLVSHHGQDVAFKGLGKIGTELCNKFIVGLTTIIGGINLAGIAGGLAISKLFDVANGKLTQKKVADRLRQQVSTFREQSEYLNDQYHICRKLLQQYLQCSSEQDRKIIRASYLQVLHEIFTFDCQQFVVVREADDGWKVVELENNEEFEEL